MAHKLLLSFVRLAMYEHSREGTLSEEDECALEQLLLANPYAGAVVAGTGGVRKVRIGRSRLRLGKRGGARVLYYYVAQDGRIYLLYAYAKTKSDDLSAAGKNALRTMIAGIEQKREE